MIFFGAVLSCHASRRRRRDKGPKQPGAAGIEESVTEAEEELKAIHFFDNIERYNDVNC